MSKRNLILNYFLIFISLMGVILSFRAILETQKKSAYNILLKQAQISGRNIEKNILEFEHDLRYCLSTTPFHRILPQDNSDKRIKNPFKKFYSKYQNMIASIEFYNEQTYRILTQDDDNYFKLSSVNPNDSLRTLYHENLIIRNQDNISYIQPIRVYGEVVANMKISLLPSLGVDEILKNYYTSKESWNWLIDEAGNIITIVYSEKHLLTADCIFHDVQKIVTGIRSNLQGEIKHSVAIFNNSTIDEKPLLSAYYPIKIFNQYYGVIFSVDEKFLYKSIRTNTFIIIISFFFIIFLVILLFLAIIKQRKNAEQKIREESKNFRNVYVNNFNAISTIYEDNFVNCNNAFVNMLHADNKNQVLNSTPSQLSPKMQPDGKSSFDKAKEMISIALEQGFNNFEWIHKKITGEDFPVAVSLTKIFNDGKPVLHCVWKDLTTEKQMIGNLKKANKMTEIVNLQLEKSVKKANNLAIKADSANRAKSEFLANMSHELRTPLNSLLVLSKNLADNEKHNLSDKQLQAATIIHKSGKNLLGLINEILDLSRIEVNELSIANHEFMLNTVVDYIDRSFRQQAEQKELKFSIKVSDTLCKKIISDPQRLNQIIRNIISNAVKFTEKGSITIYFGELTANINITKPGLTQKNCFVISITDTGIGIPIEIQDSIFDIFHQADGSLSRKYDGIGLGLSMSLKLIHLLGGELQLKSVLGEGSTFTVILPININEVQTKDLPKKQIPNIDERVDSLSDYIIRSADEKNQKPITSRYESGIQKKNAFISSKRVLIVDNDMRSVFSVAHILEENGIATSSVSSGQKAIETLTKDAHFDLILIDTTISADNGIDTIKHIRNNLKLMKLPIISLTTKAIMDANEQFVVSGANDYLTKPIDVDKLLSIITIWLYK